MPRRVPKAVTRFFAKMGREGGLARGVTKRRGTVEYYRELSRKGVEARMAKCVKNNKENENV